MSDVLWSALIAAGAALGGSLGTAALAGRITRSRDDAASAERFRIEQRQAIVDLLHAGQEWSDLEHSSLLAEAMSSDDRSATMEHATNARRVFQKALVKARLLIKDADIRSKFSELEATADDEMEWAKANIEAAATRKESLFVGVAPDANLETLATSLGPALQKGRDALGRVDDLLGEIERLSSERLTP